MTGHGVGGDVSERALFDPPQGPLVPEPAPGTWAEREAPAGPKPKRTDRAQVVGRWARSLADALRLEAERGGAFVAAPVLVCLGALVYFALPFEPGAPALAAALALAVVAVWRTTGQPALRALFAALLLALVGAGAAKIETWRAGTKIVGGDITTLVTGRILVVEERANGRTRLTLDVLSTARPQLRYQPDRIRVTVAGRDVEWAPGDVIEGVARLMPPLGPLRPQSYDFAFEAYFDGIGANGFFMGRPRRVEAPPPDLPTRVAIAVEQLREGLADRIRGYVGGAEGEIAAALVAGVRAGIPEEANEALRITGLAHVLSISGLHMALVAGVVIATLRLGFALAPAYASRRPVRKFAAGLALVALTAYLLISGAEVAAQRSYIMIAVMLVALLFDRAALTMRNLAIAALVILLWTPHEAVGPSFQMSFAATAALIAAYGWWSQRGLKRSGAPPRRGRVAGSARRVLLYAGGLAATSIIAGLATGIFGAWHFHRVSPLGLVANLAAMPVVSVVVMPMAVLGMVLMPLDLDGWAFALMGKGLTWTLDIATWLAERSPLDAVGTIPLGAVVLLGLALAMATVATTGPTRALALLPLVAGLVSLASRDLPQVLVAEDARLVGIRTGDGDLAVNRPRVGSFIGRDWSHAALAGTILRPIQAQDRAGLLALVAARPIQEPGIGVVPPKPATGLKAKDKVGFVCAGGLCMVRAPSGQLVAHAATLADAADACGHAAVIVIEDATAANPCPHQDTLVITARHTALRGSVAIGFDASGDVGHRFALPETLRPWHDHRRFSRAARGMAPYQPKPRASATTADGNRQGGTAERRSIGGVTESNATAQRSAIVAPSEAGPADAPAATRGGELDLPAPADDQTGAATQREGAAQ